MVDSCRCLEIALALEDGRVTDARAWGTGFVRFDTVEGACTGRAAGAAIFWCFNMAIAISLARFAKFICRQNIDSPNAAKL